MSEIREFKSFFKEVGGNEGSLCNYTTRLDTYGCGCAHDCNYCYAKSLLDFRNLWDPKNPAVADIEKIRKKIRKNELARKCCIYRKKRRRKTGTTAFSSF